MHTLKENNKVADTDFKSVLKDLRTHPACIGHEKALDKLNHAAAIWKSTYRKDSYAYREFLSTCNEVLEAPPFSSKSSSLYHSHDMERLNASLLELRDLSLSRQKGIDRPGEVLKVSMLYAAWWGLVNTLIGLYVGTLMFPAPLAPLILPYMLLSLIISCTAQVYSGDVMHVHMQAFYWDLPNELESNRELLVLLPLGIMGAAFILGGTFGCLASVMLFGVEQATADVLLFGFRMGVATMVSAKDDMIFGFMLSAIIHAIALTVNHLEVALRPYITFDTQEEDPPSDARLCIM